MRGGDSAVSLSLSPSLSSLSLSLSLLSLLSTISFPAADIPALSVHSPPLRR